MVRERTKKDDSPSRDRCPTSRKKSLPGESCTHMLGSKRGCWSPHKHAKNEKKLLLHATLNSGLCSRLVNHHSRRARHFPPFSGGGASIGPDRFSFSRGRVGRTKPQSLLVLGLFLSLCTDGSHWYLLHKNYVGAGNRTYKDTKASLLSLVVHLSLTAAAEGRTRQHCR